MPDTCDKFAGINCLIYCHKNLSYCNVLIGAVKQSTNENTGFEVDSEFNTFVTRITYEAPS